METKRVFVMLLLVVAMSGFANAGLISIYDVDISPVTPTISDVITITASGEEWAQGYDITTTLVQDEMMLVLDIFFNYDGFSTQIVAPWHYSEEIGPLPQGDYGLIVQVFDTQPGDPTPNHGGAGTADFTVIVPEPVTISLLAIGMLGVIKRRINRS